MSDVGDTGTTDTQGQNGQEGGADPMQALSERMDGFTNELRGELGQLREAFQSAQTPDVDDFDEDDFGLYDQQGDLLAGDEFGDDFDQQEAQEAAQRLQAIMQQQTEQAIAPIKEQLDQMRVKGEANDIAREFPDLDNPEIARSTVEAASRHAQRLGNPDLAGEPWFLRMTYLAGRAEEQAQQETPAGGQDNVRLEGAGGVSPQLQEAEEEFRQRILGAGPTSIFGG